MSTPKIQILNRSSVCTDADIARTIAPLQTQLDRDFAPLWNGLTAILSFVTAANEVDPDAWQIVILDDTDQADALGYHDLTEAGRPLGKVFAKADQQNNASVSVTLSHELLEMVGDPWISSCSYDLESASLAEFVALEVCDACEDDQFAYDIDGVLVSDFVTPAWFQRHHHPDQFDYRGLIKTPLQLLAGGYIAIWSPGVGWSQRTASKTPSVKIRGNRGSRRERRAVPRDHWRRSTPPPPPGGPDGQQVASAEAVPALADA